MSPTPRQVKHAWLAAAAGLFLATAASAIPASAAQAGTLTTKTSTVGNGATITFRYSVPKAGVNAENWVGLYETGQTPGQVASTTWQYTPGNHGTVTFSTADLDGVGSYSAYYLYDNAYQVLAGPVTFTVTATQPAPAPVFERSLTSPALDQPDGVAAGSKGQIWVADTARNRVEGFGPAGKLNTTFGQGALSRPEGIAADASGNVWVADTGADQIVEFSPSGAQLVSFGSKGSGDGQLDNPTGLAVAGGDVYVADQGNNRIEEFSSGGGYLASIPVASPFGVAVSAAGDIWVSSPSYADGNAVYEFSATGSQLTSFGATQASYGAMSNLGGIAIGPHGRLYVAQPDYGWVSVYNPDGSFYTEFGLASDPRDSGQDLAFPQAVAVDPSGHVYVADSGGNRIAEFAPPPYSGPRAAAALLPGGGSRLPWLPLALLVLLAVGAAATVLLRWRLAGPGPASPAAPASPVSGSPISPYGAAATPSQQAGLPPVSRRTLLTGATALTGVTVGAGVLPPNLRKALAATLKNPPRGSVNDIEHIVILMQENRSFDHYFGTFPGVRGFDDPTAVTLPGGNPVYCQPDPSHAQGYLLPFHYDTRSTSAQATPGTDHSWPTQHQAWDNGLMDAWVPAKGPYTMGYFKQEDIPFHWALAEAFTLCDNYHCSVLGPTNPNRLYMWTGMIDPLGGYGGPIIDNTPAYNNIILSWTTYPERLERAGLSWQVYQEEDNYDDNALAWFKQFGYARTNSPLWQHGMLKKPAGWFESDARAGRLPQVSWLVAPTAQTEHPDYFPAAGAEYIAQKLDAIAANPDLWAKTAFILTYDENDGMFDHVPPPTAAAGTAAEFVDDLPIGLGFRVPCTLVSPWTAGGRVYSGVLDHTSLIRFIEARFGVREPNISAYRRRTCGDFTPAFHFNGQRAAYPAANRAISLATTEAGLLIAQQEVNDNPLPVPPAVNQPLPPQ
jgi:phospholipase C